MRVCRCHSASLLLLALVGAGCVGDYKRATVGVAPFVRVGRTELEADLELDGPAAAYVTYAEGMIWEDGGHLDIGCSLSYAPLAENDTGRGVGLLHVDMVFRSSSERYAHWLLVVAAGPSVVFLDFRDDDLDTLGVGWYLRLSAGVAMGRQRPIDIFADVHGWLGADYHGLRAAYSLRAGASINCIF